MRNYVNKHFKYKYPILILVMLGSLLGMGQASKLSINLGLDKLLPDDSQSVREMNKISEEIGGVGHLSVLIGPTENPEKNLALIEKKLKGFRDIKYVFYKTDQHLLQDKVLYLLKEKEFTKLRKNARILFNEGKKSFLDMGLEDSEDKKRNIEKAKEYFKDFKNKKTEKEFFLSKDKRYALLMIKPIFESVDLERSEKLNEAVSNAVKEVVTEQPFQLLGRYVEKVKDTRQIEADIKKTGLISTLLIVFFLILGLGSIKAAAIVVSGVILALGWTIGFAYLFIGQINILTGFLMAILAGLGADYGIHLVRRYYQEIDSGHSKGQALLRAYHSTGRALFSSAVSTAVAFFCLSISDFRGFSELGIIAGCGVLSIFLVFMLSFPVMGSFLSPKILLPKVVEKFGFFPLKQKRLKYIFLILPFLLYGIFHASFEYDFNRMRDLSKESHALKLLIDELYGKSTSPVGIMAKDKAQAKEIVDFIEEGNNEEVIQESISIASLVSPRMKSRHRKIKKLNKLISSADDEEIKLKTGLEAERVRKWLQAAPYGLEDLPIHLRSSFGRKGNIVLLFPQKQIDNKEDLSELAGVLGSIKKEFPEAIIGSDTLVFNEIIDHIVEDGKIIILVFLLGIFITFLIDFRSVSSALALEMQIALGIVFLLGLMGLFDVKFTIMNVGIFPAILAAGIDMGVHIHHREKEGYNMLSSVRLSANPIHVSLITTFIGFGSLLFAEAKILHGISWLAILGLFGMYIVCLIFRPALGRVSLKVVRLSRARRNITS